MPLSSKEVYPRVFGITCSKCSAILIPITHHEEEADTCLNAI